MRRKPDGTCMTEAEYTHSLAVDRCVIALHDLGSRDGATAKGVRAALKKEGFTNREIQAAVEKMADANGVSK